MLYYFEYTTCTRIVKLQPKKAKWPMVDAVSRIAPRTPRQVSKTLLPVCHKRSRDDTVQPRIQVLVFVTRPM